MAVLLDTDALAPAERAEAVEAAMRFARVPATLTHDPSVTDVRAYVEAWELGAGVSLLHRDGTGIRLQRSVKQTRQDHEPRASFTLLGPGRWRFGQRDVDQVVDSARWGTCLVDQASAYEFVRMGASEMYAASIDLEVLGLPADVVHAAACNLTSSPLHRLVVRHILGLSRALDDLPNNGAITMLGTATVELVRALISTTVPGAAASAAMSAPTLLELTRMYIDRHATDPRLCPEHIAREHHVSLRQLYIAWSNCDVTLATYLMTQRLEIARRALAEPRARARTIASVAHQSGFLDAAHFSRRFRDAYAMSPREWRQLKTATTGYGP